MTDNEKLIEQAREAVGIAKNSIWRTSPDADGDARHEVVLDQMLAVFEKAHTPTDDEREALAQWLHLRFGKNGTLDWDALSDRFKTGWRDLAGDAPLRRSVVPEPSDEHECTWACWVDRYGFDHHPEPRGDLKICQCYRDGSELVTCARHAEPQGETSDAQGIIARALMDSARMDTFNAWSLAEEIAAALRAAGVGGVR